MSIMNQNAATLIVGENLKAVKVEFTEGGTRYSYLCAHDVEEGQQVVVSGYADKLKIVTVVEVGDALDLDLDVDYNYKFVLSTIDTKVHDNIIETRDAIKKAINQEQRRAVLESIKERIGGQSLVSKLLANITK